MNIQIVWLFMLCMLFGPSSGSFGAEKEIDPKRPGGAARGVAVDPSRPGGAAREPAFSKPAARELETGTYERAKAKEKKSEGKIEKKPKKAEAKPKVKKEIDPKQPGGAYEKKGETK